MNKLLIFVVLLIVLISIMVGIGYNHLEEKHKSEINTERQLYNELLNNFKTECPYKLGDDLIPFRRMKQ